MGQLEELQRLRETSESRFSEVVIITSILVGVFGADGVTMVVELVAIILPAMFGGFWRSAAWSI